MTKKERKKEKDSIMENRLSENNMQKGVKAPLNTKFRYKRTSPSYFRNNRISILIKSCTARGRSELGPKELQIKTIKTNKQAKQVWSRSYLDVFQTRRKFSTQ